MSGAAARGLTAGHSELMLVQLHGWESRSAISSEQSARDGCSVSQQETSLCDTAPRSLTGNALSTVQALFQGAAAGTISQAARDSVGHASAETRRFLSGSRWLCTDLVFGGRFRRLGINRYPPWRNATTERCAAAKRRARSTSGAALRSVTRGSRGAYVPLLLGHRKPEERPRSRPLPDAVIRQHRCSWLCTHRLSRRRGARLYHTCASGAACAGHAALPCTCTDPAGVLLSLPRHENRGASQ